MSKGSARTDYLSCQRPPRTHGGSCITILKLAWKKWRAFAHVLGNFQARVLLTVLYIVVAGPTSLLVRWRSDPLWLRRPGSDSFWHDRTTRDRALEDARRQG